ncbi:MAG: nucleoid-associated protein EbfC [Phycisphaerales bacterium]|jgi:DNA-binding YbaB/EbfC family protein|nr:nucleoid-associated protein EbfC [Phycisphaerales bacterium]
MFDGLKNLGNIRDLLGKLPEMQQNMQRLQEEMARKTTSADAGGGMVTATVNGRLEVMSVKIDKSRIDVNDTEMLEDLIVAAIRAAQGKIAQEMQTEMSKMTSGLGLPPGMM